MSVGRHTLSLVASQGTEMSPPSRSLEVTVLVASVLVEETVQSENDIAEPGCSAIDPCLRSIEIVRSPGLVSSPVSAPNGRILFVVDGRQIQSVSPTSASPKRTTDRQVVSRRAYSALRLREAVPVAVRSSGRHPWRQAWTAHAT